MIVLRNPALTTENVLTRLISILANAHLVGLVQTAILILAHVRASLVLMTPAVLTYSKTTFACKLQL